MNEGELEKLVAALRRGESPAGTLPVKRNPVRVLARADDLLVKVFLVRPDRADREADRLERARRLGLHVPEVVARGEGWLATRFRESRPATRDDLALLLTAARGMHDAGMLHGDFHVGNLRVDGGRVLLTDLQRARFLPFVPGLLRRWELGFLAFSLGEPLPAELAQVRGWTLRRARRHWRSRTRRCVMESGGFTAFEARGERGFRRREVESAVLVRAIEATAGLEPFKDAPAGRLWRAAGFVVKEHPSTRAARRAWLGARGLEARGIGAARAFGWAGRFVVMEDAGATAIDWVEREFATAGAALRERFALELAGLLAALHRRGIYHPDLKANNVAWSPTSPPRLLDFGRVRFGRRISLRRRVKNLAQLNAALPDTVPGALRELALRRYLDAAPPVPSPDRFRRRVIDESLRRNHRWSGCGVDERRP